MAIDPPLPQELVVDSDITLRPMFTIDPQVIHSLIHANLDHLGKFLVWARADYNLDAAHEFSNQKRYRWNDPNHEQAFAIVFEGELAGTIGIKGFNSLTAAIEVGYWLSEHLQGKGIMTRSAAALIRLV